MPRWFRWPRAALVSFCVGALADYWLTARLDRQLLQRSGGGRAAEPVSTSGRGAPLPGVSEVPDTRSPGRRDAIEALRGRRPVLPVDGVEVERWKGSFDQSRGDRTHRAVDILAPRGTPVRAVEAGTIAKLLTSGGGGLSVYQFDPGARFIYYYAHLDSYEPGLDEGDPVVAGQVIGYVGTTGNAPRDTPHLHFAILHLAPGDSWWQGTAVDPYEVFRD